MFSNEATDAAERAVRTDDNGYVLRLLLLLPLLLLPLPLLILPPGEKRKLSVADSLNETQIAASRDWNVIFEFD